MRMLFAALAALLVAAPVHAAPPANFACADGAKLTLIVEPRGTGLVMLGGAGPGAGGALRLEKRRSAAGLWYTSDAGSLRVRGATATFTMQGRASTTCRRVR